MFKKSLLILSLLGAAVLIGCSTTENSNTTTANNSNSASGSTTTTTTASTPATTAPAASGDKIGVPECDDFIAKYEACVSGKVPEMARAQYQTMLKQWRDSWKQLAANPQTRGTLASACKQAREQQEAALKSFGCTW